MPYQVVHSGAYRGQYSLDLLAPISLVIRSNIDIVLKCNFFKIHSNEEILFMVTIP